MTLCLMRRSDAPVLTRSVVVASNSSFDGNRRGVLERDPANWDAGAHWLPSVVKKPLRPCWLLEPFADDRPAWSVVNRPASSSCSRLSTTLIVADNLWGIDPDDDVFHVLFSPVLGPLGTARWHCYYKQGSPFLSHASSAAPGGEQAEIEPQAQRVGSGQPT